MTNRSTSNVVDFEQYKGTFWKPASTEASAERLAELSRKIEATGEGLDLLERRITVLEGQPEKLREETASARNIYNVIGGAKEELPTPLIKAIETLHEALGHLDQAATQFLNEIVRESEMDLYFGSIRRLTVWPSRSRCFRDAITALTVALQGHTSRVYSSEEIGTLRSATKLLAENFSMSEETLTRFLDLLDDSDFDLAAPLRDVELHELAD